MRRVLVLPILLFVLGGAGCEAARGRTEAAAPVETLFEHEGDIRLGPRLERFDYQSFDPSTGRLFVAEMSAGKLLVFDTRANRVLAEPAGFPKVTGVLAVPELHKLYASVPGAGIGPLLSVVLGMAGLSSGSGRVAILDAGTLAEIARVPAGVFPNGLAYDPDYRRVFVTDELGNALSVIDGETNQTIGRIDLGGRVGNVRYDPLTKRIYAAVKSTNELVAVDPWANRVVARTKLVGGKHPHGLIIAPRDAVGFVACDEDDRLLVVALGDGRVLANLPIAHEPDVLTIDAKLNRLYAAAESGQMSIFDIRNAAEPTLLGTVQVADNAHTVEVDPNSHRVFLPLRDIGGDAVLRILRPRQ